jgi:hypothetical protein
MIFGQGHLVFGFQFSFPLCKYTGGFAFSLFFPTKMSFEEEEKLRYPQKHLSFVTFDCMESGLLFRYECMTV